MSDSNSGELRGFGFIQYDDFDNADAGVAHFAAADRAAPH